MFVDLSKMGQGHTSSVQAINNSPVPNTTKSNRVANNIQYKLIFDTMEKDFYRQWLGDELFDTCSQRLLLYKKSIPHINGMNDIDLEKFCKKELQVADSNQIQNIKEKLEATRGTFGMFF